MMDRPTWNQYFMAMAHVASTRSEDPSTKVGCVIVSGDNRVISTGYNGFVAGCYQDGMCFDRPMKYHLIIHAEMNALMFARQDLRGAKLYCTDAPCENCLKHILQSGIRYVMFDRHELMIRHPDISLEACIKLIGSVRLDSMHNTEDEWYGNLIREELDKRGDNELRKPAQSQLL